ncbi:phage head closure protein [Candidatus Magnetaquicoccus inordinatus]|uniref:phage head closure protein n=1 Tax=Candidatus Magnetaquicoccus inordinatus TaxID=2496818 RepID=UPI00102B12B0|nr:phage head closure protein [Candidatus Magnetaquicoccus inordinatus]
MNAGELNFRATFQARRPGAGSFGDVVTIWKNIVTVWAALKIGRGQEKVVSGRVVSATTWEIVIRYNSELANPKASSAFRILCDGRTFSIQAVIPDRNNGIIKFTVIEGGEDD